MINRQIKVCELNTSKIKLIHEKDKIDLIKKAQKGDIEARNKMVEGNLRLVLSVTQKFSNRGEPLDDIFQIGTIGLIKAIDNFDISQNTRFSTYAVPMIIGEIRRYIRDNSPVKVSRSMKEIAYKTINLKEEIFKKTGIEPTIEELSEKLEISKEMISISLEAVIDPLSLDEPMSDENENTTLLDQLESDNDEFWTDSIVIEERTRNLSKKEKLILSMRYLKGLTQTEVAKKLRISQAQVSRIEKNTISKITDFVD